MSETPGIPLNTPPRGAYEASPMQCEATELMTAAKRGDRDAFDAIYRRYVARVYGTAYRLTASYEDAEDTTQEVFLRLANKAATISNGVALSAWIYRTTVNCATDCLRRRRPTISLDDPNSKAAPQILA